MCWYWTCYQFFTIILILVLVLDINLLGWPYSQRSFVLVDCAEHNTTFLFDDITVFIDLQPQHSQLITDSLINLHPLVQSPLYNLGPPSSCRSASTTPYESSTVVINDLSPHSCDITEVITSLLQHQRWEELVIIYDEVHGMHYMIII